MKLNRQTTVVVVIDLQQRMMTPIDRGELVVRNVERLIRGAHVLGVPVLLTEQYVKGLGPTVEPIRVALEETSGYAPVEKMCFSAHGCGAFVEHLASLKRPQLLVAGVETHVCVYQTCVDLIAAGYDVSIAADAVSSRTPENRQIALDRLVAEGVHLTSTEMALFEMLVTSGTDEFRAISKLVK
jgi:nicotinamidase-related amidase